MTVVVCQQLAPLIADLKYNIDLSVAAISEAVAVGGEVIVLPELITTGYVFESRAEAKAVAISPNHEVFAKWRAAAGPGRYVVSGFAEVGPGDSIFNSLAIVGDDIPTTIYRKLHLWDNEKKIFTCGSAPPPLVQTRFGALAAIICYDLEFPELTRSVALQGAQLLAVPTNWPLVERPMGERPPEVVIGMAAARVNRMAIACCDRAGVERGTNWTSGTSIISADGWVVADSSTGPLVIADLDLNKALDKQISDNNNLFGDRRSDIYGD